MIQECITLLVLILSPLYISSLSASTHDITSTCVTLCVETDSVEVIQQCHCKMSEGDITRNSKSKAVVEFSKRPSDDKACEEIGRGIGGCLVRYLSEVERRCVLKNCDSQKIVNFKPSLCHGEPVTSGIGVRMTCVMCTEIQGASTHIQTCNIINKNAVCTYTSSNISCVLTTNPTARKQTASETVLYLDIPQNRQTLMKTGDVIISRNINGICERIQKAQKSAKCPPGFCDAVRKGNSNLILKPEIINCRTCTEGRTMISHAVHNSQFKMFDVLLAMGADVSFIDRVGDNVLHLACGAPKNVTIVRTLVELGMDVEKKGYSNKTPLLTAARYGDISMLKYLVDLGTNLNSMTGNQFNILHLVCENADVDMLDYILRLDLSETAIESKTTVGYTPLHIAVRFNKFSIVKFLYGRGCNLATKMFNGNTVLHNAAVFASLEMVKFIISKNVVMLDSKNIEGYTALHAAVKYNKLSVVKFICELGCNLTNKLSNGNTILHTAAEFAFLEMVKFIISKNVVQLDSLNNLGETPLMTAKRRLTVRDKFKIIDVLEDTQRL